MLLRKKVRGVTLFEMLLVLLVSGSIAVATFKYQQQQKVNAVANVLANRMYLFSQTVREYVSDNQAAIMAGTFVPTPPVVQPSSFQTTGSGAKQTYVFTGVSWINNQSLVRPSTGQPYVSASSPISFNNLSPLELGSIDGKLIGDEAVTVSISGANIVITYGMLYVPAVGSKNPEPQAAVAGNAAKRAEGIFDPLLGASSFSYTGGLDPQGALVPIVATLSESLAPDNDIQVGQPLSGNIVFAGNNAASAGSTTEGTSTETGTGTETTGTTGTTGTQGGTATTGAATTTTPATSQNTGSIQNVQSIQFNPANNNNEISGLENMTFGYSTASGQAAQTGGQTGAAGGAVQSGGSTLGTPGEIDNLGTLNFAPETPGTTPTVINNIETVNFATGGNVTNLQTMNMASGGTIDGLASISFTPASGGPAQVFSGIAIQQPFSLFAQDVGSSASGGHTPVSWPGGAVANTANYFCGLSTAQFIDGVPASTAKGCQLLVDSSGNYTVKMTAMNQCSVICFKFAPP